MPTPDYILDLRRSYGHGLLLLPGVSAVVLRDDQVLLTQRTDNGRWSLPAGIVEPGEQPGSAMLRELLEETGHRHEAIEFLGGTYTSAGFSDEYVHLFVARIGPEPEAGPEAGITLVREPLARLTAAARAGRVRDAKTALALLLAEGRPPP